MGADETDDEEEEEEEDDDVGGGDSGVGDNFFICVCNLSKNMFANSTESCCTRTSIGRPSSPLYAFVNVIGL